MIANPYCKAVALVGPSLSQRIFGNMYAHIIMRERPTRMFGNEEEAITWLKTFVG